MCVVFFCLGVDPMFPVVILSNRDEFMCRPSLPLGVWTDMPFVIGGRDKLRGGGWLAITKSGKSVSHVELHSHSSLRFAVVTNVRRPEPADPRTRSRGILVSDFLSSSLSALAFFETLHPQDFAPFNMVAGTLHPTVDLWYHTNCPTGGPVPRHLDGSFHALTNATLDSPWPKALRGLAQLRAVMERRAARTCPDAAAPPPAASLPAVPGLPLDSEDATVSASQHSCPSDLVVFTGHFAAVSPPAGTSAGLPAVTTAPLDDLEASCFAILADRCRVTSAGALPKTGCAPLLEYALSGVRVDLPELAYGTCQSTVLLVDSTGTFRIAERTWSTGGMAAEAAALASPYASTSDMVRALAEAFRRRLEGRAAEGGTGSRAGNSDEEEEEARNVVAPLLAEMLSD